MIAVVRASPVVAAKIAEKHNVTVTEVRDAGEARFNVIAAPMVLSPHAIRGATPSRDLSLGPPAARRGLVGHAGPHPLSSFASWTTPRPSLSGAAAIASCTPPTASQTTVREQDRLFACQALTSRAVIPGWLIRVTRMSLARRKLRHYWEFLTTLLRPCHLGQLPGAFKLGRRWRVSLLQFRATVHGPKDGAAKQPAASSLSRASETWV